MGTLAAIVCHSREVHLSRFRRRSGLPLSPAIHLQTHKQKRSEWAEKWKKRFIYDYKILSALLYCARVSLPPPPAAISAGRMLIHPRFPMAVRCAGYQYSCVWRGGVRYILARPIYRESNRDSSAKVSLACEIHFRLICRYICINIYELKYGFTLSSNIFTVASSLSLNDITNSFGNIFIFFQKIWESLKDIRKTCVFDGVFDER